MIYGVGFSPSKGDNWTLLESSVSGSAIRHLGVGHLDGGFCGGVKMGFGFWEFEGRKYDTFFGNMIFCLIYDILYLIYTMSLYMWTIWYCQWFRFLITSFSGTPNRSHQLKLQGRYKDINYDGGSILVEVDDFFPLLEGLKIADFDEQKNWALLLKKAVGVLGVFLGACLWLSKTSWNSSREIVAECCLTKVSVQSKELLCTFWM